MLIMSSHNVLNNRDNISCAEGEGHGDFTFACDMDNMTTGVFLFAGAVWLDTQQTYFQPRKEKRKRLTIAGPQE